MTEEAVAEVIEKVWFEDGWWHGQVLGPSPYRAKFSDEDRARAMVKKWADERRGIYVKVTMPFNGHTSK